MKTVYVVAALFLFQGSLLALNGGGDSLTAHRDPFYDICGIDLNITHPLEGGNVYSNQVEINFTVAGADTCRYRTTGGWNTIPCNGSITRTLSYGVQTLTLQGYNRFCLISDSVTFEVVDFAPSLVGNIEWFLFVPALFGLWLLFDEDRGRQRKRRLQQRP